MKFNENHSKVLGDMELTDEMTQGLADGQRKGTPIPPFHFAAGE